MRLEEDLTLAISDEMTDPWVKITRWFRPLTNRTQVKTLVTLGALDEEDSSLDIRIFDTISLAKTIGETRSQAEAACRNLMIAGMISSPNQGFIKGQRGYKRVRDVIPEVQLTTKGINAAKMIHNVRFHHDLSLSSDDLNQEELLEFIGKIDQPLKRLQDLITAKKEKLG